jgi:hypothetical protein
MAEARYKALVKAVQGSKQSSLHTTVELIKRTMKDPKRFKDLMEAATIPADKPWERTVARLEVLKALMQKGKEYKMPASTYSCDVIERLLEVLQNCPANRSESMFEILLENASRKNVIEALTDAKIRLWCEGLDLGELAPDDRIAALLARKKVLRGFQVSFSAVYVVWVHSCRPCTSVTA